VFSILNIFVSLYEYFENFDIDCYSDCNKNNYYQDNLQQNNYNNTRQDVNCNEIFVSKIADKNSFELTQNNKKLKNEVEEITNKCNTIMDRFYDVVNVIQK